MRAAPNDWPTSSMAVRLFRRDEQEKMSMCTVPVSGQVCRTACDSARISTHVTPVPGKLCDTASTTGDVTDDDAIERLLLGMALVLHLVGRAGIEKISGIWRIGRPALELDP